MHENSLFAWAEGRQKAFCKRSALIIGWLRIHGKETDRQIAYALGFTERNSVSPRITELIRAGIVREVGSTKDEITGKKVRVVEVAA